MKAGLAYVADSPMDLSGARESKISSSWAIKGRRNGKSLYCRKESFYRSKHQTVFSKKNFARSTGAITLTNDWERYEISLSWSRPERYTAPFAIELLKGRTSATQAVYFKFITCMRIKL